MSEYSGKVMTVLGPVEPEKLGNTIMHEHLYYDVTAYREEKQTPEETEFYYEPVTLKNLYKIKNDPYSNRDNCVNMDRELTLREMSYFSIAGGGTIVDVTPGGVNEGVMEYYAPILKDLSRSSHLNIVSGFGHYVATSRDGGETPITMGRRDPAIDKMSPEEVGEIYADAVINGFGDTGVHPGIIGELGTSYHLMPQEEHILKAAAYAQKKTGLSITLHMHPPGREGHKVLDVLENAGADPTRVVMGHSDPTICQTGSTFESGMEYLLSLAKRGPYIEFDLCGNDTYFKSGELHWWLPSDRERARAIHILCEKGYEDRILLSHDTGHKYYMKEFGGWGWAHAITGFRRTLLEEGIELETIEKFTVDNPMKVLTII